MNKKFILKKLPNAKKKIIHSKKEMLQEFSLNKYKNQILLYS